jgi:hypothetical protein
LYAAESSTPTLIASLFYAEFQAISEEPEGVEQGTFAYAILPDYGGEGSQRLGPRCTQSSTEHYVLQHPVILDSDAFEYRH